MEILKALSSLKIPFSGTTISDGSKKYHISPFQQISISGIGPIFYQNSLDGKIYTALQRRHKDNFQWWFPGGYVDLPSANLGFFKENLQKIKDATIGEFYENSVKTQDWQSCQERINNYKDLKKTLKNHKIDWPKDVDANWQEAWQREVFEESGVDLEQFKDAIILSLKMTKTLMIGAEADRLVNIDGKFCGFLGELEKPPILKGDHEIVEVKWIALDEISFDEKKQKYLSHNYSMTPYVVAVIEESLFEIISYQIKLASKIINPITQDQISKFDSPQNMQSYILDKIELLTISDFASKFPFLNLFLGWEFGKLDIGKNLCHKDGILLYNLSIMICNQLIKNTLASIEDLTKLENKLQINDKFL